MARRSGYETYMAYYKKYAASGAMKESMLNERGWEAMKRQAKRQGFPTVNFSRNLASRQRIASSLQMRITWGATKIRISEIKIQLEKKREELRKSIQEKRKEEGKRRYSKKNLEKHVEKELKKELKEESEFFEEYGGITWEEFKFKQKDVLEKAKTTVESRALWDEAFYYVYEDTKK